MDEDTITKNNEATYFKCEGCLRSSDRYRTLVPCTSAFFEPCVTCQKCLCEEHLTKTQCPDHVQNDSFSSEKNNGDVNVLVNTTITAPDFFLNVGHETATAANSFSKSFEKNLLDAYFNNKAVKFGSSICPDGLEGRTFYFAKFRDVCICYSLFIIHVSYLTLYIFSIGGLTLGSWPNQKPFNDYRCFLYVL